jgi:hypothetical protein
MEEPDISAELLDLSICCLDGRDIGPSRYLRVYTEVHDMAHDDRRKSAWLRTSPADHPLVVVVANAFEEYCSAYALAGPNVPQRLDRAMRMMCNLCTFIGRGLVYDQHNLIVSRSGPIRGIPYPTMQSILAAMWDRATKAARATLLACVIYSRKARVYLPNEMWFEIRKASCSRHMLTTCTESCPQ